MTNPSSGESSFVPDLGEGDVLVLIKKMQQQLVLLEKKIDLLIGQSPQRFSSEKHSSRPFRRREGSFGRSSHSDFSERPKGQASGFKKDFHSKRHYGKRPEREGQEFSGYDRKPGSSPESSFRPGHPSKERYQDRKDNFKPRKKFFPRKQNKS